MNKRYFVMLLLAGALHAQVRGTIAGYVRDPSGAMITGASVGIANQSASQPFAGIVAQRRCSKGGTSGIVAP